MHSEQRRRRPSGDVSLKQRHINVDATSWRCIDVDATLYKRLVPVGVRRSILQWPILPT